MDLIQALAAELGKDPRHVENVVHLLDEGNTIPLSPATARSSTVQWTIPLCARSKSGSNTSAVLKSAAKR